MRVRVGDSELLASRVTLGKGPVKVVVRPERVRVGAPGETGENACREDRTRRLRGAIAQIVVILTAEPRSGACWQRRCGVIL